MQAATHDVVFIGAGLSGLVGAILMAETGRRVLVLEQHAIPGGYLQQFFRKKTAFDVGFHYMGSTARGRPMRQMLEHLRVFDRLDVVPLPADRAIEVRHGERAFGYPTTFAAFRAKAQREWPHEAAAIARLCDEVDATCGLFKWFAPRRGVAWQHPRDLGLSPESFATWSRARVQDPWLREVLALQSFNLGLFEHEIPWVKHVLAFRSNFDATSRIRGGGGALVAALVERGRELGVEYRFRQEVVRFECEGREVRAVHTQKGDRVAAGTFVAACHPKPIVRCLPDAAVPPMFKDRVLAMRDSRGALQVWAKLAEPLRSLQAECVLVRDDEAAGGDPPIDAILVLNPNAIDGVGEGGPRIEAMTYLDHAPFASWEGTASFRRGPEYDAFKQQLAARMLRAIAKVVPELPDLVGEVFAATPLTDAHYTKSEHGAVFGISHDVDHQGTNRPMPRMRLRNLFFSGASLAMPGICGVFINAFDTASMLRADEGDALFESIAVD
jgi:all-trans-retinol 13,14-reductase